jgi:hypothetical protein
MTKKATTDAQSMLASFKRSPEVERGQEPSTLEPSPAPTPEVNTREGRVNVGIRASLHDRVRREAFERRLSVQEVVERALNSYFEKAV